MHSPGLVEVVFVAVFRRGERVVAKQPSAAVVVFKHREVNHPQWFPVARGQAFFVADFDAQCANRVVHHFGRSAQEDDIAVLRAGALKIAFKASSPMFFTIGDCRLSRPAATLIDLWPARPFAPHGYQRTGCRRRFPSVRFAPSGTRSATRPSSEVCSRIEYFELNGFHRRSTPVVQRAAQPGLSIEPYKCIASA